jgi:hypothetical protein
LRTRPFSVPRVWRPSVTTISAGSGGRCAVCLEYYQEGDPIVVVDDEWVHEECEP